MSVKPVVARIDREYHVSSWYGYILPIGLPLLLGLVLGPLLAALIVIGNLTPVALAIPFLIPVAILLIRYPFAAIFIWLAVLPWFPFRDDFKYFYFVFHRLMIPLALGISLLSRMLRLKKRSRVEFGPPDLAMVAYGVTGIISIFVTGNDWKTIFILQDQFLVPLMAYWLVRLSNVQERNLKQFIVLMLPLFLAQGVIGLLSWFVPEVLPSIWINPRLVGNRIMGTFRQPAAFAYVLIFFLAFLLHDAMQREKGFRRELQTLILVLGIVCIFFTFTRGAWLAGILALLGLVYLYPKPTVTWAAVVIPIMLILSTSVLANEFAHAYERLNDEGTAESRVVLANAGKNMFYARPVFGWGYGNYDRYDWKFMERVGDISPTTWQIRRGTSHHTYLTILAEMGAVGFFFYIFPLFWWMGLTFKALPRLPKTGFWSQRLLIAMWLPIGAHLVLAQDLDMRFFYYSLTLYWINLGLVATMVQRALQLSNAESSHGAAHVYTIGRKA